MTKWKPEHGEFYYVPSIDLCRMTASCSQSYWCDHKIDIARYNAGFVCKTPGEAINLAKKMLAVAKER